MGLFGNKFEQSSADEGALIKRAESEIGILSAELEKKDWTEVWDSLCHTELNSPSITAKMSPEAIEKFKNVIVKAKEVFEAEKENVGKDSLPDKDLVNDIRQALDKISEKL